MGWEAAGGWVGCVVGCEQQGGGGSARLLAAAGGCCTHVGLCVIVLLALLVLVVVWVVGLGLHHIGQVGRVPGAHCAFRRGVYRRVGTLGFRSTSK